MKHVVFGKMLLRIVLIFNVLFVVCALALRIINGEALMWSWFSGQYPGLLLWPTVVGVLTFLSLRLCTIRITYDNKRETTDRLLQSAKGLGYDIVREQPHWSVFKVRRWYRRVIPGYEDTLLVYQAPEAFEVTTYREDARVIEQGMTDKG